MSRAKLLRKLSRKFITLPAATAAAREANEVGPEENVEVQIRKVRAGEVTAHTGMPPALYKLAVDRQKGETREEQRERLERAMGEDPTAINEAIRNADDQQRAVIALGVVDPSVSMTGEGDAMLPDDFGDDYAFVHDQIVEFSSLDYQRLGGAGMEAFREERVGDSPEPDGGAVRDDPKPPPS